MTNIKSAIMKYLWVCVLLLFFHRARTQNIDEYQKFLTCDSSQSWIADSSAVTGFLTLIDEFEIGSVLTFRLADNSVIIKLPYKEKEIRKWQLIKVGSVISLKIDEIKAFEIDFIKKNSLIYMRLRGAESPNKNIYVCEYYFKKSI
jgi:hypothetical protein